MSRLQALMELANVEFLERGSFSRLHEARSLAQKTGAFTTLVLADLSLGWCLSMHAELGEARAIAEEALDLCRRMHLDLLPHALQAKGFVDNLLELSSGESCLTEALTLAPDDFDVVVQTEEIRAENAFRSEHYELALTHCEQGLAILRSAPASVVPSMLPALKFCALAALRRFDEARQTLYDIVTFPGATRIYLSRFVQRVGEALMDRSVEAFESALGSEGEHVAWYRAVMLVLGADIMDGPVGNAGCVKRSPPSCKRERRAMRRESGDDCER